MAERKKFSINWRKLSPIEWIIFVLLAVFFLGVANAVAKAAAPYALLALVVWAIYRYLIAPAINRR